MPGTVIVAGIPGVGKTTVLQELEAAGRARNVPLKVVNFGSIMNEIFKHEGKALHRDHMRKQDISSQSRVQLDAARRINEMSSGKEFIVVDTHMFVRTNDGLWPGTPRKVLEALDPNMIVLIEAKPEEIASRRKQDTTRERESVNVEDAVSDLEWSRYMASANAVIAGIPIKILMNPEGGQKKAAENLLSLIIKAGG